MSSDTLLVITGIGIPDWAARGLNEVRTLIDQAFIGERTTNGKLVNTAAPQFQLYRLEISCTDVRAPAFDGIFPGALVTVSCVGELSYPVGGSPQRSVVSGSSRTENGFVFYRPQLSMMVVGPQSPMVGTAEWAGDVNWRLILEELEP
jgi:hypothetical protein